MVFGFTAYCFAWYKTKTSHKPNAQHSIESPFSISTFLAQAVNTIAYCIHFSSLTCPFHLGFIFEHVISSARKWLKLSHENRSRCRCSHASYNLSFLKIVIWSILQGGSTNKASFEILLILWNEEFCYLYAPSWALVHVWQQFFWNIAQFTCRLERSGK